MTYIGPKLYLRAITEHFSDKRKIVPDGNLDLDRRMKNIINSKYLGIYKHFKIHLKDNCLK